MLNASLIECVRFSSAQWCERVLHTIDGTIGNFPILITFSHQESPQPAFSGTEQNIFFGFDAVLFLHDAIFAGVPELSQSLHQTVSSHLLWSHFCLKYK